MAENLVRQRQDWTFEDWMDELVRVSAPRMFALVQETEDDLGRDGELVAWGLAFDDHAEVVAQDSGMRGTFASARSAVELFSRNTKLHLVWHCHT